MDPEISARAASSKPLSLYEAQSYVSRNRNHPVRLFQVAEMIRARKLHKAHPRLSWLQPPVLYRACFLMLPTYAPPVMALARGLLRSDFFETERMLLGLFDVPTFDAETGAHRLDHVTTVEAFALLGPQYPMAIKAHADDKFHRLRTDSIERSIAMAGRVLAILEARLIPEERLTREHVEAGIEAARVMARGLGVRKPVTDTRGCYEAYRRGFELVREGDCSSYSRLATPKDRQGLADAMGLIRHYHPHAPRDAAELADWAAVVNEAFGGPCAPRVPLAPAAARRRSGPLRVGYISPDFRSTAVGWFLTPLLSHFDRARFEVYVYNNHTGELHADPARVMFRAMPVHWFESGKFTEQTLLDVLQSHELDVLVDLLCYHRPAVLARKPVARQLTYLGYPGPSHIAGVDGRVVDAITDPEREEHAADAFPEEPTCSFHEEPAVRLRRCFVCFAPMACYGPYPIDYRPPTTPGTLRLGVFNKSAKFTDSTVLAWRRILELRPGAELWFKRDERYMDSDVWEEFRDLFGSARSRVRSFPFAQDVRTYFDYHNQIDLALDTWPYSGTTTTCSALYMGVPVLTVSGKTHAERVSESILRHAGLGRWVCGGGAGGGEGGGEGAEQGPRSGEGAEQGPRSGEGEGANLGNTSAQPLPEPAAVPCQMPHWEEYVQRAVNWQIGDSPQRAREALREQFMAAMDPDMFMREWERMLEMVAGRRAEAKEEQG